MKLGLSVYPHIHDINEIIAYLKMAKTYGYQDVYTTIQSPVAWCGSQLKQTYQVLFDFCRNENIIVHVDINKNIMDKVKASPTNLRPFKEMGIDIIRLDFGFEDDDLVSQMTLNSDGIIIEENASMQSDIEKRLECIEKKGDLSQVIAFHNFFPREETGLALSDVVINSKLLKNKNIKVGGFINALNIPNVIFGLSNGLCTVENHRHKPSYISAGELMATNCFDYMFFGDCFVSEKDLMIVSEMVKNDSVYLPVNYLSNVPPKLIEALELISFQSRTDQPERVLRATQSRGIIEVEPFNNIEIEKGSLTIDNKLANRYHGELQIALETLSAKSYVNVIGSIDPIASDLLLLLKKGSIAFRIIGK